jgi:hypothetical protein
MAQQMRSRPHHVLLSAWDVDPCYHAARVKLDARARLRSHQAAGTRVRLTSCIPMANAETRAVYLRINGLPAAAGGAPPATRFEHERELCMTKADKPPMRLTSLHLLLLGAIALLLLAAVAFVQLSKRQPARELSSTATAADQVRSATLRPSGRQRCMRKCAVFHKGYVYRPEQYPQGPASVGVEPEFCGCV